MKLKKAAKLAGFDAKQIDPAMLVGMLANASDWIKFSQQNPEKNTVPRIWEETGRKILGDLEAKQ